MERGSPESHLSDREGKSSNKQPQKSRQHSVRQVLEQEETYCLCKLQSPGTKPWMVSVEIDRHPLTMEINTVQVQYQDQDITLPLTMVEDGDG